jgi:hypothetical protein
MHLNDMQIASIFTLAYRGKRNFMTPNIVERGYVDNLVYELSWGEGIMPRTRMYGVTVLTRRGEKMDDLNKGGLSLFDAHRHIEMLPALMEAN